MNQLWNGVCETVRNFSNRNGSDKEVKTKLNFGKNYVYYVF